MNVSEPIQWRKSSYSDHQGGECVEVAGFPTVIVLRDSKNPSGPRLAFKRAAFRAFTREIRSGRHGRSRP